jgi:diaminobutyrate-2-oxoglutarate transaminase
LSGTTFMPYDTYLGPEIDTMDVVEAMLRRPGSGIDAPAAILIEMVQGEGGLNCATSAWLKRLAGLAREIGSLLIIDDIQAGNGRTGTFFSFENYELDPDIVVLSKSLSGFGNPLSLVLIRPELDVWEPGEHNGTFRGNNLAFVGATAALETYWRSPDFEQDIAEKAELVARKLAQIVTALPIGAGRVKGRGLFTGIEFFDPEIATSVVAHLFESGVIIETCGPRDQVLKLLPALTIGRPELENCLALIEQSIIATYSNRSLQTVGFMISEPA